MSGTGTVMQPQEKMRSRDVNKVARGEQAPRPPQQTPNVSKAPPPSSTSSKTNLNKVEGSKGNQEDEWLQEARVDDSETRFSSVDKPRYCYTRYLEYHICTQDRGKDCENFAKYYKSQCPSEWIEKWNKQRERGAFPSPV